MPLFVLIEEFVGHVIKKEEYSFVKIPDFWAMANLFFYNTRADC